MLRNYLTIALRNLAKNKVYASINIVGLSVAFASAFLLFLTAAHEFSYDNFHQNRDRIFRVYFQSNTARGVERTSMMPAPLKPALQKEFGEIEYVVRHTGSRCQVRYKGKELQENLKFTDPDFFRMFTFPLRSGNPATVLSGLDGVVLNEYLVKKYFGDEDPLGKQVELKFGETWQTFTVTGVAADFPSHSSLQYFVVIRFEHHPDYAHSKDQWDNSFHVTYVQLAERARAAALENKLKAFTRKHFAGTIQNLKRDGAHPDERGELMSIRLLSLRDLHFNTEVGGDNAGPVNRTFPLMLLVISGFVVLIAGINFVNLSVARSMTRAREVGMRKVLGAGRYQIMGQFWGEACLLCLLALLAGGWLGYLALPEYKAAFGFSLSLDLLRSPWVAAALLAGFGVVTLLAGGYPALLMARFRTVQVLKGKVSLDRRNGLRNVLVTVQFAIATLLIGCTLIAWQQIGYLRSKPLGYNEEQVISIPVGNEVSGNQALQRLRDKLAQQPRILHVTGSYRNFGMGLDNSQVTSIMGFDYKNREVRTHYIRVDYDFLAAMDIPLVAGRDFSRRFPTDTATGVIINESMAKQLGEQNPVGVRLPVNDGEPPLEVIGVVKDFHFQSLHSTISPLTLSIQPGWPMYYVLVKVSPDDLPATMETLKRAWAEVAPNTAFNASFLNENDDRQYKGEERLSKIFIAAAGLAIVISCMGLFAMAVLVMAQRTKEIGIRKVLGASVLHLVGLLSGEFLKLVGIAIVVAVPLAWYAMDQWLQNFPYSISIGAGVLALAGGIAVTVALLTVSFRALKAARANPVDSLRSE
jgi:ABC-type antimicrobial peptide transport system permease subunit